MDFETIRLEHADGVATITLHRPDRLNAWTPVMGRELTSAFRAADRDRDVRAVILTGAGRAFCAGADMEFFAGQIRSGGGTGASLHGAANRARSAVGGEANRCRARHPQEALRALDARSGAPRTAAT